MNKVLNSNNEKIFYMFYYSMWKYEIARINKKYLSLLISDEREHIRADLVKRIKKSYYKYMLLDYYSEDVIQKIIMSIDDKHLIELIKHKNYLVRFEVAKRIDPEYLPLMMNDSSYSVRTEVAKRIDKNYLPEMLNELYAAVLIEVIKRIDIKYLNEISDDNYYVNREIKRRRYDFSNNS